MSATATATMLLVLAFVWGGFLVAVIAAIRKERRKRSAVGTSRSGEESA